TVTDRISHLRFLEGSTVLWEATGQSGAPRMVQQAPGQSLQAVIDQSQDPIIFFTTVQLPQYLARSGEGGAYGASTISATGIKNMSVAELRNMEAEARKQIEARSGTGGAASILREPIKPGTLRRRGPAGAPVAPGGGNKPGAPTGGL